MKILKKLFIKNYKGLKDISFETSEINIIVGRNNTGKSSILESIGLLLSSLNGFKDSLDHNIFDVILRAKSINSLRYLINFDGTKALISANLLKDNSPTTLDVKLEYFDDINKLRKAPMLYNLFTKYLDIYIKEIQSINSFLVHERYFSLVYDIEALATQFF